MINIAGNFVTHTDFLKTYLPHVHALRYSLRYASAIIEAPRRSGKTSIIKEFKRQEDRVDSKMREFNVIFFDLEGEETIGDFCFKLYKELLNLYWMRKGIDTVKTFLQGSLSALASRLKMIKFSEFELELREKTGSYDFSQWKEKLIPLIMGLNSFDFITVFAFDEFPAMLMNFRKAEKDQSSLLTTIDRLLAWLRSLRQSQEEDCQYRFIFCGSVNLRKTLEAMGLSKRINDLESVLIPPMNTDDAALLLKLLTKKYKLKIDTPAMKFLESKITGGSPYYGQLFIKALRGRNEKNFTIDSVKEVYETMLRSGNHDLSHHHSRLNNYLTPPDRRCCRMILNRLCRRTSHEQELFDLMPHNRYSYEQFQLSVDRLIYEGYITWISKQPGHLRFISPMLKDWWSYKMGVKNVLV